MNGESLKVRTEHDCQLRHIVFSASGADLRPLPLNPDRLLVAAMEGWRYLLARKPEVLSVLVGHQAFRRESGREGGAEALPAA